MPNLSAEQITYATTTLEKVIKGLASQGFQQSQLMGSTACAYRGKDNLKCAVGHIIPDDHDLIRKERRELFGMDVTTYLLNMQDISKQDPIFSPLPVDFWRRLQFTHDDVSSYANQAADMKRSLREFCNEFDIPLSPEIQNLIAP